MDPLVRFQDCLGPGRERGVHAKDLVQYPDDTRGAWQQAAEETRTLEKLD